MPFTDPSNQFRKTSVAVRKCVENISLNNRKKTKGRKGWGKERSWEWVKKGGGRAFYFSSLFPVWTFQRLFKHCRNRHRKSRRISTVERTLKCNHPSISCCNSKHKGICVKKNLTKHSELPRAYDWSDKSRLQNTKKSFKGFVVFRHYTIWNPLISPARLKGRQHRRKD